MNRKIKFLIVEDEEKSRETLLKKIEMCNIPDTVCTGLAANANEALMLTKLTPPDFILLDINLPGKNGFELLEELTELDISPQVIFTSAHTESNILLNALKKSPITYLTKPIDIDELEEAILNVCSRLQSASQIQEKGKIKLQGSQGPIFILPEQILTIKADSYLSRLFLDNGDEVQLAQSIADIERSNVLPMPPFFKADRSTILNLSHVERFFPKKKQCSLRVGKTVVMAELSQNGLKRLMEKLEEE